MTKFYTNKIEPLKNKPKRAKRRYVGFDIETHGKENKFMQGGLYWYTPTEKREKYVSFKDKEKMRNYMENMTNTIFIAHNLAFDFNGVFWKSKEYNNYKILYRGSDILKATHENENKKQSSIDTYNYFRCSLAYLGEIIGIEKLETPKYIIKNQKEQEITHWTKPKNEEEWKQLIKYNKRDCKICVDFMHFFENAIMELGGKRKITSASTAFDLFRRQFLKETVRKKDVKYKNKIFQSYHGGRTETFKRGYFKNVYYYDINSLYPSVMRKEYPDPSSVQYLRNKDVQTTKGIINKYEGVSLITLHMDKNNPNKPLIPVKEIPPQGKHEKLIFRKGTIKKWVTHIEIRKALELGYKIKDVEETIFYKQTKPYFKEFVETMYKLRTKYKKENNPYEQVVKLMMNSLYGKFGQKTVEETQIYFRDQIKTEEEEKEIYAKAKEYEPQTDILYCSEEKEYNGQCQIPIWVSYISAHARILMYDYINHKDVIYTDTDSVITTKKRWESSKELGEMELENEIDEFIGVRAKFYAMKVDKWKLKIKGIPSPTQLDFFDILEGKEICKETFLKTKEAIKRKLTPNQIIKRTKKLNLEDNKRKFEKSFNEIMKEKINESSVAWYR